MVRETRKLLRSISNVTNEPIGPNVVVPKIVLDRMDEASMAK